MKVSNRAKISSSYPIAELYERKQKLHSKGVKLFDFGPGDTSEETPSFVRDALKAAIPKISQYPSTLGHPDYIEAVEAYLVRRYGATPANDRLVLPTTGSKEAVFNLPFLFIEPDSKRDTVIVGAPAYLPFYKGTEMSSGRVHEVRLTEENDYLLDLAAIPIEILNRTAIAWLNYPQNPTGAICDLDYYKSQYEVAQKHGILLCSDECYNDIYFGAEPPSLLQVASSGALVFHSCSKRSGMTGYRIGFVAGDKNILELYARYRNATGTAPSEMVQLAAAAAWSDDQHVVKKREILTKKRTLFFEFFKTAGFDVYPGTGTFYLWVKFPSEAEPKDYFEMLFDAGLVVTPGEFFHSAYEKYFRLSLVPTLEDCREAIQIWSAL